MTISTYNRVINYTEHLHYFTIHICLITPCIQLHYIIFRLLVHNGSSRETIKISTADTKRYYFFSAKLKMEATLHIPPSLLEKALVPR